MTEGQRRDLEQRVRQLQDEQKALRDLALERKRQLTKGLSQRHVRHRYVYITIEDKRYRRRTRMRDFPAISVDKDT